MGLNERRKFFTVGELAEIMDCAVRTVSKLFDRGKLKGYRLPSGGGDRRISVGSVLEFYRENQLDTAAIYHAAGLPKVVTLSENERFPLSVSLNGVNVKTLFQLGQLSQFEQPEELHIDLRGSRSTGLDAARVVRREWPRCKVYLYCSEDESDRDYLSQFGEVRDRPVVWEEATA